MWSNAWMVVCLVIVVTEGHPYNDRKLHQNEVQADAPLDRETKVPNDAKKNSDDGLNSDKRHYATSSKKVLPAPMVDDDLLEFLVRVADNPTEWNKIRRVLSMLGRDETETTAAAGNDGEATAAVTRPTKAVTATDEPAAGVPGTSSAAISDDGVDCVHHLHQPRNRGPEAPKVPVSLRAPPSTPVLSVESRKMRNSWPSSEWIQKTVDNMEAARPNSVYYEDDEERLYDDDEDGDELEMLDGVPEFLSLPPPSRRRGAVPPCQSSDDGCAEGDGGGGAYVAVVESAAATQSDEHRRSIVVRPQSPPPEPPRAVATADGGHMSRYQFKRIDGGGPDDGSGVNGTYVAVVENDDGPPH